MVVWNIFFHILGIIIPIFSVYFRGVETTNQTGLTMWWILDIRGHWLLICLATLVGSWRKSTHGKNVHRWRYEHLALFDRTFDYWPDRVSSSFATLLTWLSIDEFMLPWDWQGTQRAAPWIWRSSQVLSLAPNSGCPTTKSHNLSRLISRHFAVQISDRFINCYSGW